MNVSPDLDSATREIPKQRSLSSGCDLDCKEKLFRSLADRSRLCILDTLCKGAKTVAQIVTATGLSQLDVSTQIEDLLKCGCMTSQPTTHSVLYALSAPRLLQLEAVADEILEASLKAPRFSDYD
jgi:ArsR family transcriptional regulator, cadmium/lead-responsive transcriptional repressor